MSPAVPDSHQILCIGTCGSTSSTRNKVYFWDMQALIDGKPIPLRHANLKAIAGGESFTSSASSRDERAGTPSESLAGTERSDSPSKRKSRLTNSFRPTWDRGDDPRSSSATRPFGSQTDLSSKSIAARERQEAIAKSYMVHKAYEPLKPHATVEIKAPLLRAPGARSFVHRQAAWSVGGEFCVTVGDHGQIAVFAREMRSKERDESLPSSMPPPPSRVLPAIGKSSRPRRGFEDVDVEADRMESS